MLKDVDAFWWFVRFHFIWDAEHNIVANLTEPLASEGRYCVFTGAHICVMETAFGRNQLKQLARPRDFYTKLLLKQLM